MKDTRPLLGLPDPLLPDSCLFSLQPQAIPVDMFPHTPHMELVMVFERIEYEAEEPVPSLAGHYQPSATDAAAAASTTGAPETAATEPTPASTGVE